MASIIQTYSRKIRAVARPAPPRPTSAGSPGVREIGGKRFRVRLDDTGIPSRYRKRRRNRRLALVTGGALAVGTFGYGLFALGSAVAATMDTPVCNAASTHSLVAPGPAVHHRGAQHFDLNVFNSTKRNELAAETAAQLKLRGFTIDLVINDPLSSALTIPAQVRGAKSELTELREVAAQVPGAQIVTDSRTDPSVDLTLGSGFTTLTRSPKKGVCAH